MLFHQQNRLVPIFLLLLAAATLSSCSFFYRTFPFYVARDLGPLEQRLKAAAASSPNMTMTTIGTVRYGSFTAPVWLVSFRPDGPVRHKVFLSGGVHGDEPVGTEAVMQIIEDLARDRSRCPDTAIDFVPLVNPWGWTRHLRLNGEGLDINRTDERPVPQEVEVLRNFWNDKHYDLMIDHHEDSRYDGAYLTTFDNADLSQPRRAAMALTLAGYKPRSDHGVSGVENMTKEEMKVTEITSLMLYARTRHSDHVYILETPASAKATDSLKMSRIALWSLIQGLSAFPSPQAFRDGGRQAD